ncbi:multidrug effflux MFS transporter [Bacillus sp. 2205SS5-2]|uniref:multidrug effflux MFS transporter n=1 Tax=Bacillus sp. 2205SS5-2 TaxID=3109031 RepID=UPI003006C794
MVSFILILGGLSAFGPLTIDMYLPALPLLAEDLNTTSSVAQLSLTACLVGLAVGQVLLGPYSDIHGRKKPLILSLMVYSLASILCVFTTSITLFILLRFIQGFAGSAGMVISRASLRDLFSGAKLTKFFSLLMLVNGLAPILAPVVGGQILQFMSWRGVFAVLAAIGLVMLVSVFFGLRESLASDRRKTGGVKEVIATYRLLLRDRVFVGYVLTQGFVMAAMFAYISGSTFVLQETYGLTPQMFSFVFALNGVGIILATQTTGKLASYFRLETLLVTGLSLAGTSSVLLVLCSVLQAPIFYICALLFFVVASVGIVNTSLFSLAMENQAEHAGTASALLGLLPFFLGALVAPLVGLGNEAISMSVVIAICEGIAIGSYIRLVKTA